MKDSKEQIIKEKDSKKVEKVEMRAGLEIHQQLDTGKLFCRCPSIPLS